MGSNDGDETKPPTQMTRAKARRERRAMQEQSIGRASIAVLLAVRNGDGTVTVGDTLWKKLPDGRWQNHRGATFGGFLVPQELHDLEAKETGGLTMTQKNTARSVGVLAGSVAGFLVGGPVVALCCSIAGWFLGPKLAPKPAPET